MIETEQYSSAALLDLSTYLYPVILAILLNIVSAS